MTKKIIITLEHNGRVELKGCRKESIHERKWILRVDDKAVRFIKVIGNTGT